MPPVNVRPRYSRRVAFGANDSSVPLSTKKYVIKKIKRAKNDLYEPKYITNTATATSVVAGDAYVFNPLYNISEGGYASQRIGRQIHLNYLDVTFSMAGQSNGDINYLFFMYWGDAETVSTYNFTDITNANILNTLPLSGNVASNTVTGLYFDEQSCTPVWRYLFTNHCNVATYAPNAVIHKRFYFKNKKIEYLSEGASFLNGKNLYCGVIASSPGLSNGSSINNITVSYRVHWKE